MLIWTYTRRVSKLVAHSPLSVYGRFLTFVFSGAAMRIARKSAGIVLGLLSTLVAPAVAQVSAKASKLTIEQLIEIKHPTHPIWSPYGKHILFIWAPAVI